MGCLDRVCSIPFEKKREEMEGGKQVRSSSSSSSLASELFGSRETYPPTSSSTGIFGSIFGPPSNSKVMIALFLSPHSVF